MSVWALLAILFYRIIACNYFAIVRECIESEEENEFGKDYFAELKFMASVLRYKRNVSRVCSKNDFLSEAK